LYLLLIEKVIGGEKLGNVQRDTGIMFLSIFIVGLGFSIIMPVLPFYVTSMGASAFQLGLLITVYALCQFIFAPLWGSYSDRIGRRPILIVGIIGFSLTFILMGLATRLWMLFAARIAGGVLSCAALPTAMAYVGDTTTDEKRAASMGLVGASMGMGMIFGPAIGGLLSAHSIALPFLFAGALAAVNAIMVILSVKESLPPEKRSQQRQINIIPPFWDGIKSIMFVLFAVIFLISIAEAMHQSTFALFMNGRLGLGARDIGWAFVAGGIGSVLVQGILVSRVIDRLGEEKTVQIGIAVIGLSFILFLNAMSLTHAILFMALYAGGIGLVRPSITTAVSRRTDMAQGKSMGILQGFDSLGRVIGPSLGGLLLDTRLTLAYTGAIGILAFALIFFRVSSRIKRAPRNSAD